MSEKTLTPERVALLREAVTRAAVATGGYSRTAEVIRSFLAGDISDVDFAARVYRFYRGHRAHDTPAALPASISEIRAAAAKIVAGD